MSRAAVTPAPPPRATRSRPDEFPRVLFFGPAHSGKTTLVEAVLRLASADPTSPPEPAPAEPQHREMVERIRRELVAHRLVVTNPSAGPAGGTFEVCDCDGEAAGDLLTHVDETTRLQARGVLADAVRSADALVLVVDAGASPEAIDRTFRQFQLLLGVLRGDREFGRAVGGWPVFLTLTKCDTLHLDREGPTDWLRHVEARKAEVFDRFEELFGDEVTTDADGAYHRFGSLAVSVRATSAELPPGPGFALHADASGAFGVVSLAGEALAAAREQNDRVLASGKRLRLTVLGVGGLLAAMLSAVLVALAGGDLSDRDRLAERLRVYRSTEAPPAARLAERRLGRQLKDLNAFRDSAGYAELPDEPREFVEARLRELADYKAYRAKFQPPRLGPAEVRSREQVEALAEDLQDALAPPPEYMPGWAETESVKLWAKWKLDLDLFAGAERQIHEWYRGLIRRANELLLTPTAPDGAWRGQVEALLADSARPPFDARAEVPGSPSVPVPRGRKLTYDAATRYERVALARRDWDDTRDRLAGLRDLTDAIGLTLPAGVLQLPEATPGEPRDWATARLAGLRAAFPPREAGRASLAEETFPAWFRHAAGDAVRSAVEPRLMGIRAQALRNVRATITADSPTATPENLRRLADSITTRADYADADRFVQLLTDLLTRVPGSPGIVAEFAAFVRAESLPAEVPAVVVSVPDDLLETKLVPAGPFTLSVTSPGGTKEYRYAPAGEPARQRPFTRYRFEADGHAGKFALAPGDEVRAALAVRSGGDDWRLTWASARPNYYRFDALETAPTLERVGAAGRPAPGVNIAVPPPGSWPRLPDLLRDTGNR